MTFYGFLRFINRQSNSTFNLQFKTSPIPPLVHFYFSQLQTNLQSYQRSGMSSKFIQIVARSLSQQNGRKLLSSLRDWDVNLLRRYSGHLARWQDADWTPKSCSSLAAPPSIGRFAVHYPLVSPPADSCFTIRPLDLLPRKRRPVRDVIRQIWPAKAAVWLSMGKGRGASKVLPLLERGERATLSLSLQGWVPVEPLFGGRFQGFEH